MSEFHPAEEHRQKRTQAVSCTPDCITLLEWQGTGKSGLWAAASELPADLRSAVLPSSLVRCGKVLRGTRTISFCQLYSYTHVHDTWRVYRLWHRWQHSCQPSSVASTWPKLMMFNILGHMTHVRVTWVLSCTIWCYHYTHLHTSCLTEIMFCALRWGHCPRVGFFLCPGLLRKGFLFQTGAQQLPVQRPMATLPVSLCTLIAVAVIVIDSMLGALWGGQSPAFSSRFSPSTTESWDWTLSLVWLAMVAPAELSLCHCHSYLHLPFYVTDRKSFPLLFRDLCGQSSF